VWELAFASPLIRPALVVLQVSNADKFVADPCVVRS
jgi:hypothetical protein